MQSRLLNFALAALSGVLFAISFPDYGYGWLIFVALIPLFLALRRSTGAWQSLFLGWLFSIVSWLVMVPWVIRVMSHYGGLPYATGVAIYVAMAIYLGIFGALFGWLVWWIGPDDRFTRWLLVAVAWAAVEYARTWLFMGFPWNLITTAIVDYTPFIQFDRVAGPYAMGVLILLPSILVAWWPTSSARGIIRTMATAAVCMIYLVWWTTGVVAAKLIVRPTGIPSVHAAMLQPDISQEMRWDNASLMEIFQRMTSMTDKAIAGGAKVVIWPESTVPLTYATTDFFRDAVESASREHSVDIILGSVAEDGAKSNRLWNAAFLVSNGKTVGHYDKIRLVPFGEYVPMRKALFFAEKLVHDVGDFEFGTNDHPLVGLEKYGPAICYEIVFPQIARNQVIHGATVLVTITNDAWYDGTSAPRQHFNQARLRAIETDRYLLRAGTTGISAVVDPTGTVLEEIPMGGRGILFGDFQPRHSMTPYVRLGDWFAWVAIFLVVMACVGPRLGILRRTNAASAD